MTTYRARKLYRLRPTRRAIETIANEVNFKIEQVERGFITQEDALRWARRTRLFMHEYATANLLQVHKPRSFHANR